MRKSTLVAKNTVHALYAWVPPSVYAAIWRVLSSSTYSLFLTTYWLLSANALSSCWLESNLLIAGGTPGRGADPGAGCAGGDGCAVGGGAAFIRVMALSIRWLESYLGGGDGLDGDGLEVGSGTVLVELSLSSSRLESSRNELYRGMGIEDHFE